MHELLTVKICPDGAHLTHRRTRNTHEGKVFTVGMLERPHSFEFRIITSQPSPHLVHFKLHSIFSCWTSLLTCFIACKL